MGRNYSYLKYLLRHKYFVYRECRRMGVGIKQALLHDISKFYPSEWGPYARCYYKKDGSKQYVKSLESERAWSLHKKRNKHHPENWVFVKHKLVIEMPLKYIKEMVADWAGAGLAINGKLDVCEWYKQNKNDIKLHENTRDLAEYLLKEYYNYK